MTEQFKNEDPSVSPQSETDVLFLIKRIQQQLVFLEKKIDTLISQSQEKPARTFDRPSRPGHYNDKRSYGADRDRGSYSSRSYEKRPGHESRGYGGPKKYYSGDRDGGSSEGSHFKKKYDGNKRVFDPRKKPFYQKRKEH